MKSRIVSSDQDKNSIRNSVRRLLEPSENIFCASEVYLWTPTSFGGFVSTSSETIGGQKRTNSVDPLTFWHMISAVCVARGSGLLEIRMSRPLNNSHFLTELSTPSSVRTSSSDPGGQLGISLPVSQCRVINSTFRLPESRSRERRSLLILRNICLRVSEPSGVFHTFS